MVDSLENQAQNHGQQHIHIYIRVKRNLSKLCKKLNVDNYTANSKSQRLIATHEVGSNKIPVHMRANIDASSSV